MSTDMWFLLGEASMDTLYMVLASGFISFVFGMPLGVILFITKPGQLITSKKVNRSLNVLVNIGRSVPFVILMVAVIPVTRWLVGTSIGTTAAIVPLSLAAIPFFSRVTESSLLELSSGLIESGLAMGASPYQIVCRMLLPEALPGLIQGATLTLVTLVGYSAMAGAIGGGGLGDLGIRYGYQRFDGVVMLYTVGVLVFMVQSIQWLGDGCRKHFTH